MFNGTKPNPTQESLPRMCLWGGSKPREDGSLPALLQRLARLATPTVIKQPVYNTTTQRRLKSLPPIPPACPLSLIFSSKCLKKQKRKKEVIKDLEQSKSNSGGERERQRETETETECPTSLIKNLSGVSPTHPHPHPPTTTAIMSRIRVLSRNAKQRALSLLFITFI